MSSARAADGPGTDYPRSPRRAASVRARPPALRAEEMARTEVPSPVTISGVRDRRRPARTRTPNRTTVGTEITIQAANTITQMRITVRSKHDFVRSARIPGAGTTPRARTVRSASPSALGDRGSSSEWRCTRLRRTTPLTPTPAVEDLSPYRRQFWTAAVVQFASRIARDRRWRSSVPQQPPTIARSWSVRRRIAAVAHGSGSSQRT